MIYKDSTIVACNRLRHNCAVCLYREAYFLVSLTDHIFDIFSRDICKPRSICCVSIRKHCVLNLNRAVCIVRYSYLFAVFDIAMKNLNRQIFRYVCYRICTIVAGYFFAVYQYDEVVQAAYLFRYGKGIIAALRYGSRTSERVIVACCRRCYIHRLRFDIRYARRPFGNACGRVRARTTDQRHAVALNRHVLILNARDFRTERVRDRQARRIDCYVSKNRTACIRQTSNQQARCRPICQYVVDRPFNRIEFYANVFNRRIAPALSCQQAREMIVVFDDGYAFKVYVPYRTAND